MIDMEKIYFYDTPVGKLIIGEENGYITRITWKQLPKTYLTEETALIRRCKEQLEEYFKGERKVFDLPLAPKGTAFQQKVWKALLDIPYGETVTYGDVAKKLGSSARAVGSAVGRNPISLILPCHRVVGAKKQLTGYAGGLERKQYLLALEKKA